MYLTVISCKITALFDLFLDVNFWETPDDTAESEERIQQTKHSSNNTSIHELVPEHFSQVDFHLQCWLSNTKEMMQISSQRQQTTSFAFFLIKRPLVTKITHSMFK